MIGAANSPMNMFTGGGGDAFQRGMVIGDANSAASPIARAFQNTLEKYNAHLSAQAEQQDKLDLIQKQYGLQGQNLLAGIKEKFDQSAPKLSPTEQQIDPMHPEDPRFIRNVGETKDAQGTVVEQGVKMYPQPIYDSYGRIKGYKYVNPRALSMMDIVNSGGSGQGATGDAEVASTLKDLTDLQSQLPQGM